MAIQFTLTDAQHALQQDARRFAATHLSRVRDLIQGLPTPEAGFQATRPIYEEAVRAGLLKRLIPAPFGGTGGGLVDMVIAAEELHAVDASVSLTLFANLLGLMPIFIAGNDAQRSQYVAPFLEGTGAPLAALANSEPGGSANYAAAPPHGTRTTAHIEGDSWVIEGEKHWVSSATGWDGKGADVLCVVCRTAASGDAPAGLSIIAVPAGTPGFEPVHSFDTLGHRAHVVPHFRLRSVRVPQGSLIGPMGGAQPLVAASFSGTAAAVGAMSVGLMRNAFGFALEFCRTDARGGPHPIVGYPTVGYALADAKGAIESCRWLSLRAAAAMDAQEPCALELALHAKVFCSETAVRVITNLMSVVGIDSYDHRLPLAGLLQDAMALPLFDGGNMGVRRRQLHAILQQPDYDALATVSCHQ